MIKGGKCVYHQSPVSAAYSIWYLPDGVSSLMQGTRLITGLTLAAAAEAAQCGTMAIRRANTNTMPEWVAARAIDASLLLAQQPARGRAVGIPCRRTSGPRGSLR